MLSLKVPLAVSEPAKPPHRDVMRRWQVLGLSGQERGWNWHPVGEVRDTKLPVPSTTLRLGAFLHAVSTQGSPRRQGPNWAAEIPAGESSIPSPFPALFLLLF